MNVLIEMFAAFFRIGLFSFGGGYAIIPLLEAEAVNHGWMTAAEFTDVVAVSQVTPGPIAINMATFVGFRQGGVPGSLAATFGVCLPSLVLVTAAVYFIARVNKSRLLRDAFYGLRPAVAGLIGASAVGIMWDEFFPGVARMAFSGIMADVSVFSVAVFAVSLFLMIKFKTNPVFVILGAGAVGAAYGLLT